MQKVFVQSCKMYFIWNSRWAHLVWASSNVVLAQCCPVHCPWSSSLLLLLHISRLASSILSCLCSSWLTTELRVASWALSCPSSLASAPCQYGHALFQKTIKEEGKKLKKRSQQGPQGGSRPRGLRRSGLALLYLVCHLPIPQESRSPNLDLNLPTSKANFAKCFLTL